QHNATVLTGGQVRQIRVDRRRAKGVEFEYRGRLMRVESTGEVVVSLGAFHTPKLLMQSGVGEELELKRLGIPVVQPLPGVGQGLHDHLAVGLVFENTEQLPPASARSQTACFWKTHPMLDAPNFHAWTRQGAMVTPENAARAPPPSGCWSMVIGMRPRSRGAIRLTGSDPSAPVTIDANHLSDPDDLPDLQHGLSMAREIGRSV